jgi:hypothetical protein
LAKKQFFAERRRETERKFHYSPSFLPKGASANTGVQLVEEAIPPRVFSPTGTDLLTENLLKGNLSPDGDEAFREGDFPKADSPERESRPG